MPKIKQKFDPNATGSTALPPGLKLYDILRFCDWNTCMKIHLHTSQPGASHSFPFSFSNSRRISFPGLLRKKIHSTVTSFSTTLISTLPYLPSITQCSFYTYSLPLSTIPKKQRGRESGVLQKVCVDWKDAWTCEAGCLRLVDSCAAEPTKQLVAEARVSSQLPEPLSALLWMNPASTKVDTKSSWSEDGKWEGMWPATLLNCELYPLTQPCGTLP